MSLHLFPSAAYSLSVLKIESGFDFLRPLVADMVRDEPSARPSMDIVVDQFAAIRRGLSERSLRSRVASKMEFFVVGLVCELFHWVRQLEEVARRRASLGVQAAVDG